MDTMYDLDTISRSVVGRSGIVAYDCASKALAAVELGHEVSAFRQPGYDFWLSLKPSPSLRLLEPTSRPLDHKLSSQTEIAVEEALRALTVNQEVKEALATFGWELYFFSNEDGDLARGAKVSYACPDYRQLVTTESNGQSGDIVADKNSSDPFALYLALVSEVAQDIAHHHTVLTDIVAYKLLHDENGITTESIHSLASLSRTLTQKQEAHLWFM